MKKGFTLMELMVYIAIVGIIVIVAGEAFSNSTKFRVRTQNMIRATQDAENVASIFKEDVAQMGAKSAKGDGAAAGGAEFGDNFSDVYDNVYMDPDNSSSSSVDHSSFLLSSSSGFSELTFRRVRYGDGKYKSVEEVHWFVVDGVLKRSCRTLSGEADDDACPGNKTKAQADELGVDIAANVTKFEIKAPNPTTAAETQIFPTPGETFRLIPRKDDDHFFELKSVNEDGDDWGPGTEIRLSQFYTNYENSTGSLKSDLNNKNQVIAVNVEDLATESWRAFCQQRGRITLEKDNTYEISFDIPFTSMSSTFETQPFVPGEDHMSVGFRGMNSGEIPSISLAGDVKKALIDDFMFYPPFSSDGSGKRRMRFTVPANMDTVCLAFTFACYSPTASLATLKIKNLKITKVAGANYVFDAAHPYNPEEHKNDKKNIKALKLNLQIAYGGKNGLHGETGEVEMVVPIPSNGPSD